MIERPDPLLQLSELPPELLTGVVVQPGLSPVHVGDAESPHVLQTDLRPDAWQIEIVEWDEISELDGYPLRAQQTGLVKGELQLSIKL